MTTGLKNSNEINAPLFPFSAIVGQEPMKRALVFNAIDPAIGGVLITGTRGTAKSTAARAMAALLPNIEIAEGNAFNLAPRNDSENMKTIPTPFVNLPIGATEDRVLGTLNLERVLSSGEKHFEPGLLARANRGVLYVDEVNLLPDHLIDVLLDAVAMGINRVEREGVSFTHEARVILIGTMNPEEGDLRPQLLDRFGLSVAVAGYFEAETRKEVVNRRIAFENNPLEFNKNWQVAETELSSKIERARELISSVIVPDKQLNRIVETCAEAHADGLRADITAYKTARVIAAFDGRTEVNPADVDEALNLVLAHRRRVIAPQNGNSEPPPDSNNNPKNNSPDNKSAGQKPSSAPNRNQPDKSSEPNSSETQSIENKNEDSSQTDTNDIAEQKIFGIGSSVDVAKFTMQREKSRQKSAGIFGKGAVADSNKQGQFVRSRLPHESDKLDLAIESTILAAALDAPIKNANELLNLRVMPRHFRHRQRQIKTRNLIVFVVDASGSMAARNRMQTAKGAINSLLEDSYQKRDSVALISFCGEKAREILPPTRSQIFAYRRLLELPTGGRTPLADGLKQARRIIERQQRKGEPIRPFIVVISDGRATVPPENPFSAALQEAAALNKLQAKGLCIDMEEGRVRFGQVRVLAETLKAKYTHIRDLPPKEWSSVIREWVAADLQIENTENLRGH